jgi:EAL domain-containing protein (putative c-di-GMP-specific phosphodiesterase class I)
MIAEPIIIDGEIATVSASVGVTLFPHDDADVDTLLRHADQALYVAKDAGRNRYHVFNTSHDQELRAKRELLAQFGTALASGQLRLHYQPKANMRRGQVVGAEALIRWQHPVRGLLMPAQFLSTIENTSADIALGEWVIQESLRQLHAWRTSGLDLIISINISAHHLAQKNFVSRLQGFLSAYPSMPAHCLEIEILETAALEDVTHVNALMVECQEFGVEFALDDFGTGYSSLTYLKQLPASTLKIDQSFIRDMLHDSDDLAIVEGIIGLTRAFRRTVIAEGVETVEHGVVLLQMGCDLAQGYGIARPMPPEALQGWISEWRPENAWELATNVHCSHDDMGLFMAELDQRCWLSDIKNFLLAEPSDTNQPPPLATNHCRFGRWYESSSAQRFSKFGTFNALAPAHEQLHAVGRELVVLHNQGETGKAKLLVPELDVMSDKLVVMINSLQTAISMGWSSEIPHGQAAMLG